MKLNQLRINTRLFAAFSICLGFLLLVSMVSLAAFTQFNDSVEQVVEKETTLLDAALTMQIYVRANSRRIMELAIAGTEQQQKHVEDRILANRKQSDEARVILERLADDASVKEQLARLKKSEQDMLDGFRKVADASRSGDRQQAIDLVNGDTTKLISSLTKGLEDLAAHQKKRLATHREEVKALYISRRNLVLGIAALALVAAALLAWRVARSITVPLEAALKGAHAVAAGDLNAEYATDGKDELADLGQQLAAMQTRLKNVIGEQMTMAARHESGFVSHKIDDSVFPGVYADLVRKVNDLAALHIDINRKVIATVSEYSVGNLEHDMQSLPEELAEVSSSVAGIKTQLMAINGEILKLSTAASQGNFSERGDETRFQYAFRDMVVGLNSLMSVADSGLAEIARVLRRIASGDLTERIDADLQGTFAQLRDDVNRTVDQLTAIVSQINTASVSIGEASSQIAAGNTDLASRTEEQASSLQETAASMEELTGTVKLNADNARQANQLAANASNTVQQGGAVMGQVVETMGSISASAKKIEDIISVIDGIAFQTNILALNAAVEAARAGEQGRGFAVVASEVRNLAQRSGAAAKEIKTLIGDSVDKVQSGTQLVHDAGQTMDEVVKSVKRVNDIISDITNASIEQSTGIEQVNQAVSQMDQTTQQNAALVEEAAKAAEAMEDQSRELIKAVAAFKLKQVSRSGNAGKTPSLHTSIPTREGLADRIATQWQKVKAVPEALSSTGGGVLPMPMRNAS